VEIYLIIVKGFTEKINGIFMNTLFLFYNGTSTNGTSTSMV